MRLVVYTSIMKDPKSLENNILFLAGRITRRIHAAVTEAFRLKGFDLTVEQFTVLASLWYEEGINQQALAYQLDRDKTTIARIIHIMEKKNLLVRIPDKSDQRNKLIYLTSKGKSLQDELIRTAGTVYARALAGMQESDLEAGVKALRIINKNLD